MSTDELTRDLRSRYIRTLCLSISEERSLLERVFDTLGDPRVRKLIYPDPPKDDKEKR